MYIYVCIFIGIYTTDRISKKDTLKTVENVLDIKTKLLLHKLLTNNTLSKIGGIIKCGKEANIYYGECPVTSHSSSSNIDGDDEYENVMDNNEEMNMTCSSLNDNSFVNEDDDDNNNDSNIEVSDIDISNSQSDIIHDSNSNNNNSNSNNNNIESNGISDGNNSIMDEEEEYDDPIIVIKENSPLVAIKIYKTTVNQFKNRNDYYAGDHRFDGLQLNKGGIRKMVKKVNAL
jgi:serine/threonine-protein kinase RIO1